MTESTTPHATQRQPMPVTGVPQDAPTCWRTGYRHSQEEDLLMTQNELTQPGDFEDADGVLSPLPPQSPMNPKSVPWGRLIPCSRHGSGGEQRGGIDLLPREPVSKAQQSGAGVSFLGLDGLKTSDVFNEYTLGRSNRCDIIVHKPPGEMDAPLRDWAHAMISNRHCRISCMLKTSNPSTSMDVYVEDTSGNGTLINNTTLLRRGEKRILHTGDEICLVNPATLRKKIRSNDMLTDLQRHHSFMFVNVFQREGHSILVSVRQRQARSGPMPPPCSKRKGLVDVRATNNHTLKRPGLLLPMSSIDAVVPPASRRVSPRRQMPRRVEEEYDIRDVLGSGTCGEVRRAIHRHSGEQLAVKVIALGGRNRANRCEEASAAFEAEASILQALDHPYVVKLVDVFVSPGVAVYLVMELLHGGDLFDRIVKKGKYSEVESRRVMRRLLNAIFYLHEIKNVVHRDLKPENILMVHRENDVYVKLTDFGLAKSVTDDGLKTFCGTPQYFAPEVLRRRHTVAGRGRYGKQADMWSLGVILYILLSGMPPFDVSFGLDAVADAKIEFPPDKWWNISEEAKDLVRLLLMTDPKKRISVKDACKHKWIMTEDGDTHTYPLDDPAVSLAAEPESLANKRLFAREIDRSGADTTAHVSVADPLVDTTVAETIEKGVHERSSVPPPESTAACPQGTTKRNSDLKESAFDSSESQASTMKSSENQVDDSPRVPVTEGVVQTANVEESGPESAKTIEHVNTEPKESPEAPKATLPVDVDLSSSSSTAKPTSDTKQGVCKTPAHGSPAVPLSLNARSNYFRETVLKSIEKASPAASNGDELSRTTSSEEKRSPKGILITPKSTNTNAMAIVSSRTSGEESIRPAAASKQKSKKRAPSRKVTVKVKPVESKASELPEDEICSQFSDEGDSIASFSTDDCVESMKPKAKATKRATHDPPPGQKRNKKRRIVLGARVPVNNQDGIAVSDEDVVPKEGASASDGAAKSKVVTSAKRNKAAKSKETGDDSKGQVGGRQMTLSNFFLKKEAKSGS